MGDTGKWSIAFVAWIVILGVVAVGSYHATGLVVGYLLHTPKSELLKICREFKGGQYLIKVGKKKWVCMDKDIIKGELDVYDTYARAFAFDKCKWPARVSFWDDSYACIKDGKILWRSNKDEAGLVRVE